ncbi:hypothetical protein RB601_002222 [Gaeumannomyces tritici]
MSGFGSQPLQMQPQPPPKRPHGPRLYHKKSKTGCYRCKGRRVKCDEKRPVCGGCSRHLVECVYPTATAAPGGDGVRHRRTRAASSRSSGEPQRQPQRQPQQQQQQQQAAARPSLDTVALEPSLGSPTAGGGGQQHGRGPSPEDDEDIAPPECRERRVTEMRLLYHYLMTQARTFRRPFNLASLPGTGASPAGTAASSPATAATPTTAHSSTWTVASAGSGSGSGSGSSHTNNPFGSSSPFSHHHHHHHQHLQQPGPHHHHPIAHPHPQPQPPPAGSETFVWSVETIEMAFESDAILYILLAQSALLSWAEAVAALPPAEAERGAGHGYENVADPDCHRWRHLQRQYAAMALREHRRAVAGLSVEEVTSAQDGPGPAAVGFSSPTATQTPPGRADHHHHHQPPPPPPSLSSSPADYVCMSSLMILSHAFALVQTVPTRPRWTPPLEWLQMGHGAGQVLGVAKGMLRPGRDRMMRFLSAQPRFDGDDIFTEPNRAPLMWLLDRPPPLRRGGGEGEEGSDGDYDDDDNVGPRSPPPDEGAATLDPDTPERVAPPPHMDEEVAMADRDGGRHQHGDTDDDASAASAPSNPHPSHSPSPTTSPHPSDAPSPPTDTELSDPDTRAVYERVLSYIGWTERAVCRHVADPTTTGEANNNNNNNNAAVEPLFAVCRRFAAFAVWTPEAFHEFLRARRPRALVVLAYFFALWIPFRDVWMIGPAGLDQVRAIRGALPPRWRPRLDPLAARYGIAWGE